MIKKKNKINILKKWMKQLKVVFRENLPKKKKENYLIIMNYHQNYLLIIWQGLQQQIVNKFYNTETDFENFDLCQLVEDYFNGKAIPQNTNDTGYVEAVAECVGNECPASPTREDCCSSKDGKCHLVININKLCGIEDAVKDPSIITEKEAKLLAEALSKYFEA